MKNIITFYLKILKYIFKTLKFLYDKTMKLTGCLKFKTTTYTQQSTLRFPKVGQVSPLGPRQKLGGTLSSKGVLGGYEQ